MIEELAAAVDAVRPLPPPSIRTAAWLALSLPFLALVVVVMSPRADMFARLMDTRFLVEQAAALLAGVAAAYAAFVSTIPGANRKLLLLPVFPFAVWLGTLGLGCLQSWLRSGPHGLALQPDWVCFPMIMLVGSLPAVAIVTMLRRGAPLSPCTTIALGGLAAAGLGNFGLRLFHPQDASIMVLVWQVGSVLVLATLAGCLGRQLFNWHLVKGNSSPMQR
ncbi:MAG: DUF1109 domain-containing protein [Xanthobacteraceae bacterium]|nr:DUF1109 domain-containing protein [Xanthobacteraceae bacterium]